jgi:5-methylcytosine-specific restriction protein A
MTQTADDLAMIQRMEEPLERKSLTEGGMRVVISVKHERNIALRQAAYAAHGYDCAACGFNYFNTYGSWGEGFAEVHHLKPVSADDGSKKHVAPQKDLIVLCANCHGIQEPGL